MVVTVCVSVTIVDTSYALIYVYTSLSIINEDIGEARLTYTSESFALHHAVAVWTTRASAFSARIFLSQLSYLIA